MRRMTNVGCIGLSICIEGKISEETFCDEFYYSYDLEIDKKTLNGSEKRNFKALGMVAERFSSFQSDFELAPGAYTTKEELKNAAIKAKEVLGKPSA